MMNPADQAPKLVTILRRKQRDGQKPPIQGFQIRGEVLPVFPPSNGFQQVRLKWEAHLKIGIFQIILLLPPQE
jgi:hypothetical protein